MHQKNIITAGRELSANGKVLILLHANSLADAADCCCRNIGRLVVYISKDQGPGSAYHFPGNVGDFVYHLFHNPHNGGSGDTLDIVRHFTLGDY